MALRNGRRRGGSVRGGRSVPVHRSAAETLDGFFPPQLDRCLKRGTRTKKEIRLSTLLPNACTHVGAGVAGQEQAPLGWVTEDAGTLGDWSLGRGSFPQEARVDTAR